MSSRQSNIIPEERLVLLILEKDKEAIDYLYDHYSASLYGVILRIIGEEETAEEVLQDAFTKIWFKISSYDDQKGKLFTWMLNISRNLAIDRLRSKDHKRQHRTDLIENNVYAIDQKQHHRQNPDTIGVKELLHTLNEDQQLIVNLLYFKGYTQSEVSKEYDIPLGTVKTRLRAAIKHLRKILDLH